MLRSAVQLALLYGQLIAAFVFGVTRMTLYPFNGDNVAVYK